MRKILPFFTLLFMLSAIYGCDKEKIVTTTETVHDVEYIELPPDTINIVDTFYLSDSVTINNTDTIFLSNTDTLTIHDTVHQTTILVDTIEVYTTIHDTIMVTVTDTVMQNNQTADAYYAYSALQYHTDPAVFDFINTEFGVADGWILYLSSFQNTVANPSVGVFDLTGYIDYWVPDWSSYYPLEYAWRVTFTGGDPSNPQNWTLTDPPGVVNGKDAGISIVKERDSKLEN